jgi:hypothetical protein
MFGSDVLLIPSSAAGSRALDNADNERDVPTGITGHVEAETEGPISELTASGARYCAGIGQLLRTDVYNLCRTIDVMVTISYLRNSSGRIEVIGLS